MGLWDLDPGPVLRTFFGAISRAHFGAAWWIYFWALFLVGILNTNAFGHAGLELLQVDQL